MEKIAILGFGILPIICVVCCTYILMKMVKSGLDSALLFACLLLMGIFQTIGYALLYIDSTWIYFCADAYLITVYYFFPSLLIFAMQLSIKVPKYRLWLYLPSIIFTILHIFGYMVDGYRFEQASLMHNDGPAAPLFDYFAIISSIACIQIARLNIKHNSCRILISKNRLMIISFIPLVLAFIGLVLLSRTDYAISVAIVSPLITIYFAITYNYLLRETVIDCSSGFGFFLKRLKLAYRLLETDKTKSGLKSLNNQIEKQFINETLIENDSDIFKAAQQLGMHHTTLRGKLKEYEPEEKVNTSHDSNLTYL